MRKDWIRNMESKEKAKKRFDLSRLPKPVGIGVFYGICLIVAVMVLAHNNPLAPDQHTENLKKWCACALLTLACIIFGLYYDRMFIIPRELFQSRRLIWKLAKNDFKKRYAGSYLGFLWALVQPVVTVLMYWIVFDKVFQTRAQMVASGVEVPYVLHLTAGLVPWFYFSEAITNGTNALLEYSYLVKKVVFNISILPIIKLYSCVFCGGASGGGGVLWLLSHDIYATGDLLQLLPVYSGACHELLHLCGGGVFQGPGTDYQYRTSGGNVGNADFVEYYNDKRR